MDRNKILGTLRPTLLRTAEAACAYLENLEDARVSSPGSADSVRSSLPSALPAHGEPAPTILRDLIDASHRGLVHSSGGRFFGWVMGGTLPSAIAADWLTSVWDQNAAIYATSPLAAVTEEVVGAWLKDVLHLPAAASFALVTGCQMAHVTCLAAARHALLREHGWDVDKRGLHGAPEIRVISSVRRHMSIERALRILGLGTDSITYLEPGDDEILSVAALEEALGDTHGLPTIVLLQAGDLNTGVFDRFADVIPVCKRANAWVHVDGAFGLWASASRRFEFLTHGVELADSWATDGHKLLNVPFDSGYAFIKNTSAHQAAMSTRAPYFTASLQARDEMDWNPEWSRRARGFTTYAALRELGRSGIERLVDDLCDLTRSLAAQIAEIPTAQLVWSPIFNQALVRFHDPAGSMEQDHDQYTETVVQRIVQDGEAFFGVSTWRGKRVMRISVVNWRTDEALVARVVKAVRRAATGNVRAF